MHKHQMIEVVRSRHEAGQLVIEIRHECAEGCGAAAGYGKSGLDWMEVERRPWSDEDESRAAELWRAENPGKSVFACDAVEKHRYRKQVFGAP
jgi:hypothetical protein